MRPDRWDEESAADAISPEPLRAMSRAHPGLRLTPGWDDEHKHGSRVLLLDELGSAGVAAFPKGTRRFPSRGYQ
jgi:hypothetical protein